MLLFFVTVIQKKKNLISPSTILRLQTRYGKETLEQRKLDQQPYVSLAIDGKEVHEPFGNGKIQKHNFATVVGLEVASEENPEPEENYADHFKSRETGLALANGTSEIIEDSGSMETLLVTKSDGSPNNTSPDVGMHKVCYYIFLKCIFLLTNPTFLLLVQFRFFRFWEPEIG